jgi:hypothetical protein
MTDTTPDEGPRHADPVTPVEEHAAAKATRQEVVGREKQEFGGFKFGSAFFGWLAAMGMTVILTALLTAIGASIGLGATGDLQDAAEQAMEAQQSTIGIIGIIALAVVLFIAYYCGGYVAGRMARFSGAKQGVAVWIWAVVVAIVVAIIAAIGGARYNVLGAVNGFPRIPVDEGVLSVTGIVALIVAALIPLLAAVLGGLAGMRFHRRVDKVGLGG